MLSSPEVAAYITIVHRHSFTCMIQEKAGQGTSVGAGQEVPLDRTALSAQLADVSSQAGNIIVLLLYDYCMPNTVPASSTCKQAILIH